MTVISFLPILAAFGALQALLVVKVADHMSDGTTARGSHSTHAVPGGRYFGIA